MRFLLRYGEMGLKSPHVRKAMKQRLMANASRLFKHEGDRCAFLEEEGRLFLESDSPGAQGILARVFGLVSYSAVVETSCTPAVLIERCVETAGEERKRGSSFAVRVRRVGDHPYTSLDIARQVGSAILSAFPDLKVDLKDPAWEVSLEIRGEKAYLYTEVLRGPGGLPLGTQGRVVAFVEGEDGVLAAWLMMRRGCAVIPVYLEDGTWAKALAYWDPDLTPRKIDALEDLRDMAEAEGRLGFVFPWNVDRLEDEGPRPAFYPLVGLSEDELHNLKQRVLGPMGLL